MYMKYFITSTLTVFCQRPPTAQHYIFKLYFLFYFKHTCLNYCCHYTDKSRVIPWGIGNLSMAILRNETDSPIDCQ